MTLRGQGLDGIGTGRPLLVGMVHLLPLPGSPRWAGDMDAVVERAERDARALEDAGFDALIVENFLDAPFHPGSVPAETVAAMTRAVAAVRAKAPLPVGVNVLRNDAAGALAVAVATGAAFIRVNVHTGSMWTDQGLVSGRAHETMRLRRSLAPDVAVIADVHVKHGVPPASSRIEDAARDAWHRGLADALVVSGTATGSAADLADLERVRCAVPEATVLVGSGLTAANAAVLLAAADGAIVGSDVMRHGRAGSPIDPVRATALVAAARPLRSTR